MQRLPELSFSKATTTPTKVSPSSLLKKKKRTKKKKKRSSCLISTSFFRGNLDCLRASLVLLPNVREEVRMQHAHKCLLHWFGKDVDQMRYNGSMDLSMLTTKHHRGSRIEGLRELAAKDSSAELLEHLRLLFDDEDAAMFRFFPRTWRLPHDGGSFKKALKSNKKRRSAKETYIVKPSEGSEGNGIFLAQGLSDVPNAIFEEGRRGFVAQEYIARPMLLDGYKFDLRIYVLVTSVDPLRCHVYREGLVRLCSEAYEPPDRDNLRNAYAHLTNYSLNKRNHDKYVHTSKEDIHQANEIADEEAAGGSKRKLSEVLPVLEANSGGEFSTSGFWNSISDLVAKTLIAYQPHLAINYRLQFPRFKSTASGGKQKWNPALPEEDDEVDSEDGDGDEEEEDGDDSSRCFHILGFDVLLSDEGRSAHLLEVNSNPSLMIKHDIEPPEEDDRNRIAAGRSRKAESVPSPIDEDIKTGVVRDALRLVMVSGAMGRTRGGGAGGARATASSTGTNYLPILTAETEAAYAPLQVMDRVRLAFEACEGRVAFQASRGTISGLAFRRAARALGVAATDADLVFIRLVRSARSGQDGGFNNRTMELGTFADALEALANHPTSGGGGGGGGGVMPGAARRNALETSAEAILRAAASGILA